MSDPFLIPMAMQTLAGLYSSNQQSNAIENSARLQADAANRASQLQYQSYLQQRDDLSPYRQGALSAMYGKGGLFKRREGGTGYTPTDIAAKRDSFYKAKTAEFERVLAEQLSNVPESLRGNIAAQLDSQFKSNLDNEWANSPDASQSMSADEYELDPELMRSFTMADFQADPAYQFNLEEGQKALERSAAARGGLQSGGTLKDLTKYAQGMASNEYQNAYNRFTNNQNQRFNRLMAISGLGQTANTQLGQASQVYANNVGNNMMNTANVQGAQQIAGSNVTNSTLQNLGNNWMQYTMLNEYLPAGSKQPQGAPQGSGGTH